jgi:hypothetical protein
MADRDAQAALARWLAQGCTSLTHPLLRAALETCFHPVGIEADWLEAEPFGAEESAIGTCWLRGARWNPGRLRPGSPAAADLAPWAGVAAGVDAAGLLELAGLAPPGAAGDDPDLTWRAVRHSVRAAHRAAAFIHAAAGLLLAGDSLAARYAAGDDTGFANEVWRRLESPESGAEAGSGPAPAQSNRPGRDSEGAGPASSSLRAAAAAANPISAPAPE